jgi:hypothetical protein
MEAIYLFPTLSSPVLATTMLSCIAVRAVKRRKMESGVGYLR